MKNETSQILVRLFVIVLLSGCAKIAPRVSPQHVAFSNEFVRTVDFSRAPEMRETATHVRKLCNEFYPKILERLARSAGGPCNRLGARVPMEL